MRDQRVRGLDTLRFVLACWVILFHTALPPVLNGFNLSSRPGRFIYHCYVNNVNGQAAVIVFFLISGFCIHYPFRNGARPELSRYYPRRYLRIMVPLFAWVAVSHFAGVEMRLLDRTILWSVLCEEVYYLLYPLFLRIKARHGWDRMLVVSFLVAVGVVWTNPTAGGGGYPHYGWQLNWLLGLPCWLMGCKLAETCGSFSEPVSRRTIWKWRLGVWFTSGFCLYLKNHTPVGCNHTLNYFAILAYFWLTREIRYCRDFAPPRWSEWAGKWSYSIYLTHLTGYILYERCHFPPMGYFLQWAVRFCWVLAIAYTFYLVVEKPSHAFARWVGTRKRRADQEEPPLPGVVRSAA